MASSKEYRQFHNENSSDHDDSTEANCSMDQLSFTPNLPPDESLIEFFTSAFDGNISELRDLVNKLKEITDRVEEVHRNTTIVSLSGGVIGAAGGITSIVGLILAPFTLGASLIVTGVGIGVAVAGGVTGAASNITDMVHQKTSREEIEKILKEFQNRLSPIIKSLQDIELRLDEIQRDGLTDSFTQRAQIGFGVGRGAGYAVEVVRLVNVIEIGKVAAQVSRTVRAAGAITGVLAGLFLLMDIVFIAKDVRELRRIDKDRKDWIGNSGTVQFIREMDEEHNDGNGNSDTIQFIQKKNEEQNNGNGKSAISQFIKGMKKTVHDLNQTLDKLREVRKQFNAEIINNNRVLY